MTYADRLNRWNRWYDGAPEEWRSQIVLWPLLLLGFINMQMTIAGYSFGLLFLLALLAIIVVRAPFAAGLVTPPPAERGAPLVPYWLTGINGRYDALPSARRFWLFVAAVVVITAVSLDLTLAYGMPFFLLFLIAFLLILGVRAPYVAGWISNGETALTHDSTVLALERSHDFTSHADAAPHHEPVTVGMPLSEHTES